MRRRLAVAAIVAALASAGASAFAQTSTTNPCPPIDPNAPSVAINPELCPNHRVTTTTAAIPVLNISRTG